MSIRINGRVVTGRSARGGVVAAAVFHCAARALAQDAVPPATAASGVSPKAFPLLAQTGTKLAESAGDQLADAVRGLFSRHFGAGKKAAAAEASAASALTTAVMDYRPREVIDQAFRLQHDPATP